jgi:hypothetical protein
MSSRRADRKRQTNHECDSLIRWALHDAVDGKEPSSRVWERIQQQISDDVSAAGASPPSRLFSRRLWLGWLIGAGANFPVPGDPRLAWQRRLHAFDVRAPLSIVSIVEGKMSALRLVS